MLFFQVDVHAEGVEYTVILPYVGNQWCCYSDANRFGVGHILGFLPFQEGVQNAEEYTGVGSLAFGRF